MILNQKCFLFLLLFFILILDPMTAQNSIEDDSKYFRLDLLTDGLLLGGGLLLNVGIVAIEKISAPEEGWSLDITPDISTVNPFDRMCVLPYSEKLDTLSDIFTFGAMLAPLVLLSTPVEEWLTIGTMYAESVIWALGLKELGKNIVHRNRPYTYFDSYPQDKITDGDFQQSLPSGHTTLAFTGASFGIFTFCKFFEDSPWKIPVIASSCSLAFGSAVLRVASGQHFLSDVIAGAAIGVFSGLMVPWLHTLNIESPKGIESVKTSLSIAVLPSGINVKLRF